MGRRFKDTIKARANRDPEFRAGLLQEALEAFIVGDINLAEILLRDYVNAADGFESLGDHP